jgi:hypothetical protein
MWKIGQHIKLHTNDEWNKLVGVIDTIWGDTIAIFSVLMPCYRYFVTFDNADKILERID